MHLFEKGVQYFAIHQYYLIIQMTTLLLFQYQQEDRTDGAHNSESEILHCGMSQCCQEASADT
jgi:hypothetical protein